MKSKLYIISLVLLALALAGCGTEVASPAQEPEPTPEDMGQTEDTSPDLPEEQDTSQEDIPAVCPVGSEGCDCYANQSCNDGLTCGEGSLCKIKEACAPGSENCDCDEQGSCDEEDLVCGDDEICRPQECPVATEGCACAGGSCVPGLRCNPDNTCEDNTGFAQGACFEDETCRRGNRCQQDTCVPCGLGTQGCHCDEGDACSTGLSCNPEGLCVDGSGLAEEVPGTLRCYTPCTEGVELDNGQFVSCPADGLMVGCFGDATCEQGQCLQPGQEATQCSQEQDCPDFQTCLQGRCVSNCDTSDDCNTGATCFRHVCRQTCTVVDEDQSCGRDQFCQLLDGDSGVCRVSVLATGDSRTDPIKTFSLSTDALNLGTPDGRARVTLLNESRASTTFTLTRRNHRLFEDNGQVVNVELPTDNSCESANCPMWWVSMRVIDGDTAPTGPHWEITLEGGQQVEIEIDNGQGVSQARWQGQLEISSPEGGNKTLALTRSDRPQGQWTGEAYYFGNFKDVGLDIWRQDKNNEENVGEVENAFVRLWANFRQGRLSFDQFRAGLVATRTESWRSPRLASLGCDPGSVCFPFDNFDGFLTYTTDPLNVPVPTGVVEMPMAFNLRSSADCDQDGLCYQGRLESQQALQYAGQPAMTLSFEDAPEDCVGRNDDACLAFLDQLDVKLSVGARYMTDSADVDCSGLPQLQHARIPWLLTGFEGHSEQDPETGRRYIYDCKDTEAPLPGANPVPDGRLRYRSLELVDGALINNSTMFIIFRENLETFLWDTPNANNDIQGYGYMLLQKSSTVLPPEAFEGTAVPERENLDRFLRPITCSDDLLSQAGITRQQLEANPDTLAGLMSKAVLDGVTQDLGSLDLLDQQNEAVHYLCEDTGLFDGGPGEDRVNGPVEKVECPEGSRVTFFTLSPNDEQDPALLDDCGSRSQEDCHQAFIARQDCQDDGTCKAQLMAWVQGDRHGAHLDPYYQCEDSSRAYCNDDRFDLREGKVFFEPDSDVVVFRPMLTEVGDAFRYRTRFVNRSGTNLGFVPEVCIPGTELIPYCYDPAAIESMHKRVECAVELYTEYYDHLEEPDRLALQEKLTENFSYGEEFNVFGDPVLRRGFEFLDTELMIMLGDDHYTKALSSRFDLAQTQVASFEGSLFEPNGINLSGVAGAEMHNLYKATQYYQSSLDRFYDLSPMVALSVKQAREEGQPSFITPATVESWFGRLIRASTQKSRVWAEIAERYQNFNRPDLSRLVIERAYTSAYLESMILTRLMQSIVDITAPEDLDQIKQQIQDAQRNYRVAMAVMRQNYADISDDLNYFGFAPDFIPFPSLEGFSDASFEVSLRRARARVDLANTTETQALEADISFNTNAASFQNELARIQNTYDAQLSEICGTFEAEGQVFPAISKYAYLSSETQRVGDPCGLTGTGQLHQAMGQLDITLTDMRRIRQSMINVVEEARIEEQRWNRSCNVSDSFARLNYQISGQVNDIQHQVDQTRSKIGALDRSLQDLSTIAQLSKCSLILGVASGGDCPSAIVAKIAFTVAFVAYEVQRTNLDLLLNDAEARTRELQSFIELKRNEMQCDLTAIDGQARVKTILLRLSELELEALRTEYEMNQVLSNIKQLRSQATRLQQEAAETEELAINVEAARSNPNVRIFRNDAILNADVTFYSALREVYKTTRVFEYYTGQSYGPLEQLFLTRLVSRGDYNLQLYLIELEDAFREFEDRFGLPSQRLEIISLKDDILSIPRLDVDNGGAPLTEAERASIFRTQLTDSRRLDENGYLTIPFSTSSEQLSPLTRNHKISHIEAEIIGGGQGDLLARVYLRMAGTSRVSPLGSTDPIFYTFPERLAVINPFFEGSKPAHLDPAIYRNRRMFDRPFANSRWEFVLNTFDEEVNQDLNLQGLDDIRLYIYYNDFTEF